MTEGAIHVTAARGFARAGADYERGRPGYPDAAIALLAEELGIGPGRSVLDLAAGTGKLTRALTPLGARVIAVEPVAGMREQLISSLPGSEALEGTAEAIPLPDASVDAVLVAQAFHWFDARAAAAEINRVLAPGGGLGILRNAWDESTCWVSRMQEAIHAYAGDTPQAGTSRWRQQLTVSGLFSSLRERVFPHRVAGDIDALLARVSSISYISALGEDKRRVVLQAVLAIASQSAIAGKSADSVGSERLAMPYRTEVSWCTAL